MKKQKRNSFADWLLTTIFIASVACSSMQHVLKFNSKQMNWYKWKSGPPYELLNNFKLALK